MSVNVPGVCVKCLWVGLRLESDDMFHSLASLSVVCV